jgi:glycine cleavage system aminomethyltransferase T
LLVVPVTVAASLFDTLQAEVVECGGRLAGADAHASLRLEGRFFNVFSEGERVRDPLPLGLQWMVDFEKEQFLGKEAIHLRRTAGLKQKVIGLAGEDHCPALAPGAKVFHCSRAIGEVVSSGISHVLNRRLALALLPVEVAFSGLEFRVGSPNGPAVRSISMPPIMARSLTVKLDEM